MIDRDTYKYNKHKNNYIKPYKVIDHHGNDEC